MNLSNYIIILSLLLYTLTIPSKLKIANASNPLFNEDKLSNLIFVFNHMKHGASTPCYGLNDYYTDIFEQKWIGYCELTKKGFLQLFKLGKIFQQRYDNLLKIRKDPDINKILSFASKESKTLMSSNALFYGMFINNNTPIEEQYTIPTKNFKKTPDALSDLIPIFYFTDINNCKGWKNSVNKLNGNKIPEFNDFITKFIKKYENIFELLKEEETLSKQKTWFDKINLVCSNYISNYYDDRYKDIKVFKALEYTEDQFYELYYTCHEFNLYKYIYIQYNAKAENIPPLILSELLNDMINYMDLIISHPEREPPQFLSYMGHDSTISAMQVILNKLFNVPFKLMNYGSNQIFLLFKNGNNYEIKYFYNDELLLTINYDEFKKDILNLLKKNDKNLDNFCRGFNFKFKDYTLLILCGLIVALFIANVSACFYHRSILCEKKKYISIKEEPGGKTVDIKNEV